MRLVSAFKNRLQASPWVLDCPRGSKVRHWSLKASSALLSATGAAATHASAIKAKVGKKMVLAACFAANLDATVAEHNCQAAHAGSWTANLGMFEG
eukprot:1479349-Rhodomonas_salina.2